MFKKFQAKARILASAKKKNRYLHVMGKLKSAKLLDSPEIPEFRGPVEIKDVLWAGNIEPRILEVLPALLINRPKYLRVYNIPHDLKCVLEGIRTDNALLDFRGIPPKNYCKWLSPKSSGGTRLKTFRMRASEIQQLKSLRIALNVQSEAEVLRRALNLLERTSLFKS